MNQKRKSRIWQLIITCFAMILAAFSLPIHASAELRNHDEGTYVIDESWSGGEIGLWNWLHNDFRYPLSTALTELEQKIDDITVGTGSADTAAELEEIKKAVDSIDLTQELTDFYNQKASAGSTEEFSLIENTESQLDGANALWQMVGKVMGSGGDLSAANMPGDIQLGVNLSSFTSSDASTISAFMKTLAYSLVLIFFSVNLIESTVKYEIVTLRGAVSFGGRLLVGKIVIDLSTTICLKVVGITEWICGNLVNVGGVASSEILNLSVGTSSTSSLWVIGKIIDFFNIITNIGPILIVVLIVVIISIAILIKLMIRNIQLAIMIIAAPPFFATLATDTTKHYFRNYITSFLQCALQVVFMCIVWYVGIYLLNNHNISGDVFANLGANTNFTRVLMIYIVMGIMICKPPKFLTNALN